MQHSGLRKIVNYGLDDILPKLSNIIERFDKFENVLDLRGFPKKLLPLIAKLVRVILNVFLLVKTVESL